MSTDLEKRILKQKRGVVRFSTEHFSLQNKHLLPVKPPYNEKEVLCNKPKVCKATERDALRVRLDAAPGASPRQLARRDGNRVGHPTPTYVEVKPNFTRLLGQLCFNTVVLGETNMALVTLRGD